MGNEEYTFILPGNMWVLPVKSKIETHKNITHKSTFRL